MTSKSSGLDNSTSDAIELMEFESSSDSSPDLGASEDSIATCGLPSIEIEKIEIEDVPATDLNTSDENQHHFDTKLGSSDSLKGASHGDLPRTTKSSGLTRNILSLRGPSGKRTSSLDPLNRLSTQSVSSEDNLEGSSTERVSFADPLEGSSNTRVWILDTQEGTQPRTVCLSDSAKSSSTSISNLPDSENETNEPFNSEPPPDQNGCISRMLTWLGSFSRKITHSKYYLLFHLALLIVPLSAGFMGSKYYNLCEGCLSLSTQVYFLGILGMWILSVQIASMLSKRYFSAYLPGNELIIFRLLLLIPLLLFLFMVIVGIVQCNPVFVPRKSDLKKFCVKNFYNYVYYLNWVAVLAVLLTLLIELPSLYHPVENAEEEENVEEEEENAEEEAEDAEEDAEEDEEEEEEEEAKED